MAKLVLDELRPEIDFENLLIGLFGLLLRQIREIQTNKSIVSF